MKFINTLTAFAGLLSTAAASFSNSAKDNVVLYWGQASAGSQERLSYYCTDDVDIIVLSFMSSFPGTNNIPTLNFASACTDEYSNGLLKCDTIASDIKTCQNKGIKVLLSMGGAAGSYGFSDDSAAEDFALSLWNLFGEGSSNTRPFGTSVIDGFDFDIENNNSVGYAALATKLREYFATGSKQYYLAAAPQCFYPDASVGDLLENAVIDFAFVQFYNNYCSINGQFNWDTWVNFAKNVSPNKNIKLYLGLPGSTSAAGSGYVGIDSIESTVESIYSDSQFGGVMLWDASQGFTNKVNGVSFVSAIKSVLDKVAGGVVATTTSSTSTTVATITATTSSSTTSSSTTSSSTTSSSTTSSTTSSSTTSSTTSSSTTSSSTTSSSTTSSSTTSSSTTSSTTSSSTTSSSTKATVITTTFSPSKTTVTLVPTTSTSTASTPSFTSSTSTSTSTVSANFGTSFLRKDASTTEQSSAAATSVEATTSSTYTSTIITKEATATDSAVVITTESTSTDPNGSQSVVVVTTTINSVVTDTVVVVVENGNTYTTTVEAAPQATTTSTAESTTESNGIPVVTSTSVAWTDHSGNPTSLAQETSTTSTTTATSAQNAQTTTTTTSTSESERKTTTLASTTTNTDTEIHTISTLSTTIASAVTTVPDKANSGCDGISDAKSKAQCLNAQYKAGQFSGSPDSCVDGEMSCTDDGAFAICDHGAWVVMKCAAGTTCYAFTWNDSVQVGCNFSSGSYVQKRSHHVHHNHVV